MFFYYFFNFPKNYLYDTIIIIPIYVFLNIVHISQVFIGFKIIGINFQNPVIHFIIIACKMILIGYVQFK